MVPEPVKEKLDCDENEALVQQCEQWSRELSASYPHRKVCKGYLRVLASMYVLCGCGFCYFLYQFRNHFYHLRRSIH